MEQLSNTQRDLLRRAVIDTLKPEDLDIVGEVIEFELYSRPAIGITIADGRCYLGRSWEAAHFTAMQCDWYVISSDSEIDVDWFEERANIGRDWTSRETPLRFEERRMRIIVNTEHTSGDLIDFDERDSTSRPTEEAFARRLRSILYLVNGERLQFDIVTLPNQEGYWVYDNTFDRYRSVNASVLDGFLTIEVRKEASVCGQQIETADVVCRLLCDEDYGVVQIFMFHDNDIVLELKRQATSYSLQSLNFNSDSKAR